jgi:hypothetical protein
MDTDLVGMEATRLRGKTKFTILNRPNGIWTDAEVSWLVHYLKPFSIVHTHPGRPSYIMIRDEHSESEIVRVLGTEDFEYKVVAGFDNPELPFAVPLL